MELSLDGEQFFNTNKVKYKDKEYVLENDPSEIQKKIKEKQEQEKKFLEKLKHNKSTFSKFTKFISKNPFESESATTPDDEDKVMNPQEIYTKEKREQFENEREIEVFSQGPSKKYNLKESSTSCKLSEIESIIYGGKSSRFWMLRKHLSSIKNKEFQ